MIQSIQKRPKHYSPKGLATMIGTFAAFAVLSFLLVEAASAQLSRKRKAWQETRRAARRQLVTRKIPMPRRAVTILPPPPELPPSSPPSCRTKWSDLFPNGVPEKRTRNQSRELSFSRPLTIPAHMRAAPETSPRRELTQIVERAQPAPAAPPSTNVPAESPNATPIPSTLRSVEPRAPRPKPPIPAWMTNAKPKNPEPPKCKIPRPDSRPAVDPKKTIAPEGAPRPRKITMRWGGIGQKWPPPNTAPQRPRNTLLH